MSSIRQYFAGKFSGITNALCYYSCSLAVVLHVRLFFTFVIADVTKTISFSFPKLNSKRHPLKGCTGVDKVLERGALLSGNDKKYWANHDICVNGI